MPVSPDSSGETGLSGAASEINVDDSASKLSFSLRGDGTPTPDFDGASMCSSPSSVKVSMRNTFLHFREDAEIQIQDLDSPRSELAGCPSPLRRSQSDVTEMNDYLRHRFGSVHTRGLSIPDESVSFGPGRSIDSVILPAAIVCGILQRRTI